MKVKVTHFLKGTFKGRVKVKLCILPFYLLPYPAEANRAALDKSLAVCIHIQCAIVLVPDRHLISRVPGTVHSTDYSSNVVLVLTFLPA